MPMIQDRRHSSVWLMKKDLIFLKMKDPNFNWEQMREISLAMEYGLNPNALCDPEISAESMEKSDIVLWISKVFLKMQKKR